MSGRTCGGGASVGFLKGGAAAGLLPGAGVVVVVVGLAAALGLGLDGRGGLGLGGRGGFSAMVRARFFGLGARVVIRCRTGRRVGSEVMVWCLITD